MKDKPLVSVLVPVYNVEEYIIECAESIFNQTYNNLEVIFFDDKSPDKSIEVLQNYIDKEGKSKNLPIIKIIRSEVNVGLPEGRNRSIEQASGDYICFVDSDDKLPSDSIELLLNKAIEEDADIVKGQFASLRQDGTLVDYIVEYPDNKLEYLQKLLNWGTLPMTVWGAIFKSDLIKSAGIKFNSGHNMGEDFSFLSRIVYESNRISFIDVVIYYYRLNLSSITKSHSSKNADDLIDNYYLINNYFSSLEDSKIYKESIEQGKNKIRNYLLSRFPLSLRIRYSKVLRPDYSLLNLSKIERFLNDMIVFSPLIYRVINKIRRIFS